MTNNTLTKLPNILMIIVDQDRATQHYPPGWEQEHLKSMTLLKSRGISFINGFCNTCMCSPSRSTLFSGMYPAQHGVVDTLTFDFRASVNEPELDNSTITIAKMLHPYYDTQFRGKWHMSKGGLGDVHPEKSLMGASVAVYGFNGWQPPDAGEDTKLENFGGGYAAHDVNYIDQAIDFIKERAQNEARGEPVKPFFMVVSLVNPHDVLSYPNSYIQGGYSNADLAYIGIDLPPTVDELLAHNYKPQAQTLAKLGMAKGLGILKDEQRQLNYINFYARLQIWIDREIGRLLNCFYGGDEDQKQPNQLGDDTLIIRIADHGEMGLSHGGLRQKSFNTYEESIRIPYIFSNPSLYNQANETKQLATLIDIMPTISGFVNKIAKLNELDHIEITTPSNAKGVDLSKILFNPEHVPDLVDSIMFTYDDVRAGQANPLPAANRIRCIRRQEWKYARYFHETSSYPEDFEMYFIRGIHAEKQISEDQFEQALEKLRAKAGQHDKFSTILFDDYLQLFMELYGYETVNLAYTNPDINRFIMQMVENWTGIYSSDQIVEYLDDIRHQLANELQEREKTDLWLRQPRVEWL